MEPISNNDPLAESDEERSEALSLDELNLVSGMEVAMLLNITDEYGVNYEDENQATAKFRIYSQNSTNMVTLNGHEAVAADGVFNFTGFSVTSEPGSELRLELVVRMPSLNLDAEYITVNRVIPVKLRKCKAGEEFTPDEKCKVCPEGTYNLVAPKEVKACQACLPNAQCFGGDQIAPKKFFWRPDDESDEILSCINREACLEGTEYNITGLCKEGYTGPLCSQCEEGYY